MCRGCGVRHNSVVIEIPAQVQNVNQPAQLGTLPIAMGLQSPAKFEPIRGFAMKETEEQMGMLKKENFSLKLRIYFLEEQMGKKDFSPESNADIYNALELKAEAEALKDELNSKEELLGQASEALFGLEQQFQRQVDEINNSNEREKHQLKEQIQDLQSEADEFWSQSTQEERSESIEPELMNLCHSDSIGGLSDLCELAFNTTSEDSQLDNKTENATFALPLTLQEKATINPFNNPAPLQGLFSIVNGLDDQHHNTMVQQDMLQKHSRIEQDLSGKDVTREAAVRVMERQVAMLESQVMELEEELAGKEDRSFILEGDLENLRKELEYKSEEIVSLQVEILDKDMKIESISEELQSCNATMEDKELQIHKLCEDLHNVEPEMEVAIQKIIEHDRIIEGKIEHIEAQNKIIVEIQITLDEKHKQISELEGNLTHTQHQLNNQAKHNDLVISELQEKESEVLQLKKNLKKQERNVYRLGAELKESIDMLNKVQWEAQNLTAEDSISDMAQEENEHLWAEMEQTKLEMVRLQSGHELTLANAQNTINELQKRLQEQFNELYIIKDKHTKESKECEDSQQQKDKELIQIESKVIQLTNDIANRDLELQNNINQIACLNEKLSETKEKLCVNIRETDKLRNEMKSINNCNSVTTNISPVVNQEHISIYNYVSGDRMDNHSSQSNNIGKANDTRNANEIKVKHSLLEIESNNANLVQNGTTSLELDNFAVNSIPVYINVTNKDSHLFTILYDEISDIRKDAQNIRYERKALSEKVLDLQNVMNQHITDGNEMKKPKTDKEITNEISEENKQKLNEITLTTNSQLTKLSQELQNIKSRINCQFNEVHIHSNQEIIANYQEEHITLRNQLIASNEECELLRTNLEEMSTCLHEVVAPEEPNIENSPMPVRNMSDNELSTKTELNVNGNQYIEYFDDEDIDNKSCFDRKRKSSHSNKIYLPESKQILIPQSMLSMNTTVEMQSLEEIQTYSESILPNDAIDNIQQNQYISCLEDEDMISQEEYNCDNSTGTKISINTSDIISFTPLLKNINSLCQKLEEDTTKNYLLKEQLQSTLKSQHNNDYIHHTSISEYQATVEELNETMRQLEESQALLSKSTQQTNILQQQHQVNLSHSGAMEVELNEMYKTMEVKNTILEEKNAILEEKEIMFQALKQLLEEKELLLQETSIQINANNEVIQGLSDEIEYLQKVACEKSGLEEQVSALQYSLQACESRLLQVNKERLAQVTERNHQQAQISALSLQVTGLEEETSISRKNITKNAVLMKQLEEEKLTVSNLLQQNENLMACKCILEEEKARGKQTLEENVVLIKQLENERESMSLVQEEKQDLVSDKLKLQTDMQKIQNELATIDVCAYNIQAQHSHDVQQYHIQQHNYQILREKYVNLQQKHSELQMKAEQVKDDLLSQIKNQQQLEINQQQVKNFETHIKQLTSQVETERQLTSNLRQQLETIRSQSPISNTNKINHSPSQQSEENSPSELPVLEASEINQKASCLSQKGSRIKKRKVHWSDETNCKQNEGNDCCTENTEYTLKRDAKSLQRMKSDSELETGARSKFFIHEHDMKKSTETSFSTVSSCSFSVQKKNKRTHIPVFISNGQYG